MVDVETPQGTITAHCPNTGSMRGLLDPGNKVFLSLSDNKKRKYPHTLEVIELADKTMVMVNTARSNRLVEEALSNGWFKGVNKEDQLRREVKSSDRSRLDFLVENQGQKTWIEVKNATLQGEDDPNLTQFPDAVTQRGAKHLAELAELVKQGDKAVILFLLSRSDGQRFSPAAHIDPHYAAELQKAVEQGVEARNLKLDFDLENDTMKIEARREVPIIL